jgi:hypothetical protein
VLVLAVARDLHGFFAGHPEIFARVEHGRYMDSPDLTSCGLCMEIRQSANPWKWCQNASGSPQEMLLISTMHGIKPNFRIFKRFSETNAFHSIKSDSSFKTGWPSGGPAPTGIDDSLCSNR